MRRSVRGEAPFVAVFVVVAAGFAYLGIEPGHWLRGVLIVAVGLLLAGALRAALADRWAGMLVVRGKVFDSVCYLALGAAIMSFALALPR